MYEAIVFDRNNKIRLTSFFSPPSLCFSQICIFIGETLLFLNWAITADILMVRIGRLYLSAGLSGNFKAFNCNKSGHLLKRVSYFEW